MQASFQWAQVFAEGVLYITERRCVYAPVCLSTYACN